MRVASFGLCVLNWYRSALYRITVWSGMYHPFLARLVWLTLLAADRVSPQIVVRDIPIAGISYVRTLGDTSSSTHSSSIEHDGSSSSGTSATTLEEELIEALEVDTQVTGERSSTRVTKSYLLALGTTQISSPFTKQVGSFPHVVQITDH